MFQVQNHPLVNSWMKSFPLKILLLLVLNNNDLIVTEAFRVGGRSVPSLTVRRSNADVVRLCATTTTTTDDTSTSPSSMRMICEYQTITVPSTRSGPPCQAISVEDLTPIVTEKLHSSGLRHGVVTVVSRHTTTAVTVNESESLLFRDVERYFRSLAPPDDRSEAGTPGSGVSYLHNDIDQRPASPAEAQRCRDNGWDVDDPSSLRAWRDQEPINAHSHLLSMVLGNSESIPVVDGAMVLGQWQSILMVDLDGPRERTVGVQFMGFS